jgi:hypothetical protein
MLQSYSGEIDISKQYFSDIFKNEGDLKDEYFQCTLSELNPTDASFLFDLRNTLGGSRLIPSARTVQDIKSCTMVFLGQKNRKTGFHCDWSEANNAALGIGKILANTVLAEWVLIRPTEVGKADAWLKYNGFEYGFISNPDKVHLSGDLLTEFIEHMGDDVVVLEQRPATTVYVPPGWVHQVTNKSVCLKLAWDFYDPQHFALYALLRQQVIAPYFPGSMPADYMATTRVIESLV